MTAKRGIGAFVWSALIGVLGGLMGLGGAEFRLPVLTLIFGFATLYAVVMNLMVSFVTVLSSLYFRWESFAMISEYWPIVVTLLAGTLAGAVFGVRIALKINEKKLDLMVAVLLAFIALVMLSQHYYHFEPLRQMVALQISCGVTAGLVIGLFSSLLGIAGGELLIPTIMLLYGLDIKTAGTLSLMISLPTVAIGLLRYYRRGVMAQIGREGRFIVLMALGSIVGALAGRELLDFVSSDTLVLVMAVILALSSLKLYKKGIQHHDDQCA